MQWSAGSEQQLADECRIVRLVGREGAAVLEVTVDLIVLDRHVLHHAVGNLLIVALFLFVHWRYKIESFSVFIFPLVFLMTLVASMGRPVAAWSSVGA